MAHRSGRRPVRARTSAVAALLLPVVAAAPWWQLLPDTALGVSTDAGASYAQLFASAASFGVPPGNTPAAYAAHWATDALHVGCGALPPVGGDGSAHAYVVARGNCTFADKAAQAAAAGAAVVIVYDSVAGAYLSANATAFGGADRPAEAWAAGRCSVDCAAGRGSASKRDLETASAALAGFPGACGPPSSCPSQLCLLTDDPPEPDGSRAICCMASDYVAPGASGGGVDAAAAGMTVAFVTAGDGATLTAALAAAGAAPAVVTLAARATPAMDPSGVLLSALGFVIATGAAAAAVWDERHGAELRAPGRPRSAPRHAAPVLTLTVRSAAALVVGAAAVLVTLYVLIRAGVPVVYPVLALFALGAASATADRVFLPLLRRAWPAGEAPVVVPLPHALAVCCGDARGDGGGGSSTGGSSSRGSSDGSRDTGGSDGELSVDAPGGGRHDADTVPLHPHPLAATARPAGLAPAADDVGQATVRRRAQPPAPHAASACTTSAAAVLAAVAGASVSITFVVCRRAPWAWALQDALGAVLCAAVMRSVRVTALKTAAVGLGAFFVYDVVMVFVTPFVLGGGGVMLDVATAGGPPSYDGPDSTACHCRYEPQDDTHCGPGEYMPILLRLPRLADYRGGFALLGLGDIIIPGLALAMAARRDGTEAARARRGLGAAEPTPRTCAALPPYFTAAAAGYGVGLLAANTAAALTASGQPALLYLCPAVLGAVAATAWARGQLSDWWGGKGGGGDGGDDDGASTTSRTPLASTMHADGGLGDGGSGAAGAFAAREAA